MPINRAADAHVGGCDGGEYTFEKPVRVRRSASKGSKGKRGFVDVWKKGMLCVGVQAENKYKSNKDACTDIARVYGAICYSESVVI